MPKFGSKSLHELASVHHKLQALFIRVVKTYDCTVICGHRPKDEQDKAYASGRSKVKFPHSKHNLLPAKATDTAPYLKDYPGHIDWRFHKELEQAVKDRDVELVFDIVHNIKRWYYFAGQVKTTAREMGIKVKWGGDWDGDLNFKDQNFYDIPHWELIEP